MKNMGKYFKMIVTAVINVFMGILPGKCTAKLLSAVCEGAGGSAGVLPDTCQGTGGSVGKMEDVFETEAASARALVRRRSAAGGETWGMSGCSEPIGRRRRNGLCMSDKRKGFFWLKGPGDRPRPDPHRLVLLQETRPDPHRLVLLQEMRL